MTYSGVRAVVLGASGFIGSWVARKLGEAGAETHLVVRDSAGVAAALGGRVFEADLAQPGAPAGIFEEIRPAIVFNLAGYGVDPSERDVDLSERLNALLPRAICDAAARWRDCYWLGQHVIHVGSALEYGEVSSDLREDGPANPTPVYGQTKLQGTLHIAKCAKTLELRAVTARLFTVYGPGEHCGRLLPSLIEAARAEKPLELTAGTQLRDFTYVEDVAEGLLRLGLAQAEPGSVVNLATGHLTMVRSFAETAARILSMPMENLKFSAVPTRAEEMRHEPISIERLRQITRIVPSTGIEEGIRRTLGWTAP
ncbi:MAG TPA: NAD(P)-dependent oxidoreductase [Bryobacteraceae bacterium]|nr:NAD(P)-dependent oxidoreductase [Bryobacteraceae bacterium]